MHRIFTTLLFVLSLAFTSIAVAPVQAGTDADALGKLAFGAFALVILGNIIRNENKNKVQKSRLPGDFFFPPYPKTPVKKRPTKKRPTKKHPGEKSNLKKVLPEQCLFNVLGKNGPHGVFGKICMQSRMKHADRLPKSCKQTVPIRYGRPAQVYGAACLNKHGYRLAGK